jgi:hypothetical protein
MEEDFKALISSVNMLAKMCRPVVFKHLSAAGVSEDEMKEAFLNIQTLANKYGGTEER